nr:Crp/Fnr family transcriptional regulator [Pontixanthobacter sp. CEM42]
MESGDHAFMQGDSNSNIYFVQSGLLKAYYIRADGKEHIKSFLPEGSIIGSMVALVDGDPCTFSLVASEPTTTIALPYKILADAAQSDIGLANALVGFLGTYGKRKEQREYQLLSLSAEDRFALLVETMPDIADRVSQADLAAYIGITPQALSRIKRRLK